jgi:DNA-binding Xre family transcriptional regulator
MEDAVLERTEGMNAFQDLIGRISELTSQIPELRFHVDEPVRPDGLWFVTINAPHDYAIEVQWSRHLGFGVSAGTEPEFGTGVDEIYGSTEATFERVAQLLSERAPTDVEPVSIGELRRLKGVLQKDAADILGMTKSGLNQIEAGDLSTVQVSTLKKVVEGLGAELVILARFKEGQEREIAI